jgi:chromosome segregation protein
VEELTKSTQVSEELAAKVAKLTTSESGRKEKVKQLQKHAMEAEVKQAATAGAEEAARERVAALELELEQLSQEHTSLRGGRLLELEERVEQLTECNTELVASWEAQRRGAQAVGFDLDTLLGGLSRVTDLQHEVVELEEANASLNQSNELSTQKVSALEVDLEDYEEKVTEVEQSEQQRTAEVEQLIAQIEELQTNNAELSAVGDHSSERIVALETELEEFEGDGLTTEESVRIHKEEIELLQAQIEELQGNDAGLTYYELPAQEEDTNEYEESESDDETSSIPAGHDPEDYEVDDSPSWES